MNSLSLPSAGLFLLLLFPGLVSAHVYRLIMPARELKWSEASFEALFYSAVRGRLFKSARVAKRVQVPYPSAWDFFFDKREPAFALVRLNTGDLIGAFWGADSYAATFPNDGDIYFQAVYHVDGDGRFGSPIANTRGVLLRRDQYRYIEMFELPSEETPDDRKVRQA